MVFNIEELFYAFIQENHLEIGLSYVMPAGYENAFGTFDITVKTLFLNRQLLESRPEFEILFYFYHELRHALQYIYPQNFSEAIRTSTKYVILYNGLCFKLVDYEWKSCKLVGEEEYFTLVYENMPYELDANLYARDTVKLLLPDYQSDVDALFCSWLPRERISEKELYSIFHQIDNSI